MIGRIKILVLGSKGFIGHHVLKFFWEKTDTYEAWGCDVMVDYTHSHYFLIDASTPDFKFIFEKTKFDFCINCSGAASVADSFINPGRDFHLNTVNVYKVLDAIRALNPACKFINLSSAAVYGNPNVLPVTENSTLQPLSPYGEHKRMSEEICREFYSVFGIRSCSLRIFSAYGKGLRKQIFWDLFNKAISVVGSQTLTFFGTGAESRDFIYINDLVRCILIVMQKGKFESEAINVANGQEISIHEAVDTFYSFFPQSIQFQFSGERRMGDPANWLADISVIKSMGYKPEYQLSQGLKEYYKWAKKVRSE